MGIVAGLLRGIPAEVIHKGIAIAATLAIGILVLKIAATVANRTLLKKASEHSRMIARNVIMYIGYGVLIVAVLGEAGVDLTAIMGAAGIAGIAIGFASQTSVSNIISGWFLLGEKPFTVGDVIKSGEHTGIIIAIDLMSIKIRTFDNLYIRLPNAKVLNTEVINMTRFPIRRLDLTVSVAYKEDLSRVKDILTETARKNPFALSEPEPLVIIQKFADSGIEIFLGVWFLKNDLVQLKNSLLIAIKERFDAEGIEMPFPHSSLYAGEATKPFPVRIVGEGAIGLTAAQEREGPSGGHKDAPKT